LLEAWRHRLLARERERVRLTRIYWESERLRAELSHLEQEIYRIRESDLTRRQKQRMEGLVRVRVRRIECEMLSRQTEIAASGEVLTSW
jgi:hypothetical protein